MSQTNKCLRKKNRLVGNTTYPLGFILLTTFIESSSNLFILLQHFAFWFYHFSCVLTDNFIDFMYATYAKLAYKLMILVKHFCVLIFSIFRVFVTICHFSDVTINSFNSCVVAYFLNYISRLYRLTLRLLVNTQTS